MTRHVHHGRVHLGGVLLAICLNMIIRSKAHIVREVLHSVAPYIRAWLIVDTGSDDGTQDVGTGLRRWTWLVGMATSLG